MTFCAGPPPTWSGTSTQNDLTAGHGSCRRRCSRGGDLQGTGIKQARPLPVEGKANPVTERDWSDALLVNAALDIHADDPAFGYRFIADELPGKGILAGENRVQRLCRDHGIWSVFSKKRGLGRKPGPPVHDDLFDRNFPATAPNQLWLTGITEHPTAEGKLYLCAVNDVYSGKIVGYSLGSRTKCSLAVAALENAVRPRSPTGTVVHSDRLNTPNSGPPASLNSSAIVGSQGPGAGSMHARTTPPWSRSSHCCIDHGR